MNPRSVLRFLILAAVTVGFVWLFLRQADLGAALDEIGRLPSWAVAAGVGAVLANLGLAALRWRFLLASAGFEVDLGRLFRVLSAGIGVNNVLPARAGDLVRIESLRRGERVPAFVIVGTLFAERLLDGVVLSVWILTGALLLGDTGALFLAGVALSAGSALGVVLVAIASRRPAALVRLVTLVPRRWRARAEEMAASFVAGLAVFRGRRTLALVLGSSALVWLADLGLYIAVGTGFGLDTGLGGYLALEGVGNLALGVPATAAGVGSFDYLTVVTAMNMNVAVPRSVSTGYVLVLHALVVLPPSILGLLFLRSVFPAGRRPAFEPA